MQTPVSHVAHVTECLAGGTLAVLRHLAEELARLHVRQTLVYSRRPDSPRDVAALFPPTMRLIEVRAARGPHLEFAGDLARALHRLSAEDPPDIFHLHSSKAGFVGRLAGARSRILYSPHGLAFLNPRRPWSNAACWLLERLAGLVDCQPVSCGASEARALASVSRRPARVLENPVDSAACASRRHPRCLRSCRCACGWTRRTRVLSGWVPAMPTGKRCCAPSASK
jgi:hypothetical protein